MNIRQLESLVRAVELGSFGAAAKALHTTQSTISVRIRELEELLGTQLFDRSYHRAHLTPKGQELLPGIKTIVDAAASLCAQAADAESLSGVARVGVVGRIAYTWLPDLVRELRSRHPNVTFQLELGLTKPLMSKLRAGELDVALVGGPIDEANFHAVSLGFDEFAWMAAPALKVPSKQLTARDLQAWPVLGLSDASPHFPAIEQWFEQSGASYHPTISCNDLSMVSRLVIAGLGIGLLHKASFNAEVAAGKLHVLRTEPRFPAMEFVAVTKRNAVNPLADTVVSLANQVRTFSGPSAQRSRSAAHAVERTHG